MTITLPTRPLNETEKAVAAQLVAGLGVHTIAAQMSLSPSTVRGYLKAVRTKLRCHGAPQHLLVHAILSAGQAPTPVTSSPAPDVSPEQIKLWHALASHKLALDVAHAAGIAPTNVKEQAAKLFSAVGTADLTRLVILGHAWGTLSPLTATERRIVEYLLRGLTPDEIAAELKRPASTAHRHLRSLRYRMHCRRRCPLPVLVHRLLISHQATAPATDTPVPYLDAGDLRLLHALAEESTLSGLAAAAGLSPADVASAVDALIGETGASSATQLVVLAHSWTLLPAIEQDHARRIGASQ
ncbi:LuxR C-terminal-related transcriptional regulator [Streptomyces sp. SID10815]|uniref:LuxR C-terminal-related transcriptional regulator n=1 Tax=Streptomyces sp. SID10815 TaxID=2706027 RepID=UPI0013C92133|nr:LuxR C-terminal-related transcriptional regulator [Streptomyces sp. SID10815]NEA46024.1 hypothetical protein [Streptomyces sp. SID10815]